MKKKIVLYSTGCPKCAVLKKKLDAKGVTYEMVNDESTILSLGITKVPVLCVDNTMMEFGAAVEWVNTYEGGNL